MSIKVYKEKTILEKFNGDKITVDKPFSEIEKIMDDDQMTRIKISSLNRKIRKTSIHDFYSYNVTDELEAWIEDTYPDIKNDLKQEKEKREKEGFRNNKEIIQNIAQKFTW